MDDDLQVLGTLVGWAGINADFLSIKLPPEDESIFLTDADNITIKNGRIKKLRGTDYLNSVSTQLGESGYRNVLGVPIYRKYEGTKQLMAVLPTKFYQLVDDETWTEKGSIYGGAMGTMTFDSGSVEPQVNEVLTGATSEATAWVVSVTKTSGTWAGGDAVGTISLKKCYGCFNDNENINGSIGGSNILTANHPDGSVGVDRFVKNGAFVTNVDPPNDWSTGDSTLTTEAGGQVGNCMQITYSTSSSRAYQSITTEVGKIYKVTVYFKLGTATSGEIRVGIADQGYEYYDSEAITDAAWTVYTTTFEATTTTTFITLYCIGSGAETVFYDEISSYELGLPTNDSVLSYANADNKFYFVLDDSGIVYDWDGINYQATTFTAEGVTTLRAKYLLEYKTFLILLNTNEDGTAYYQRFWASNAGLITKFSSSEKLDLEVEGVINGGKKLENSIIVYFDQGVYRVEWQEDYGWTHEAVVDGVGLYCPKTLTGTKDVHYFISQEGLMEYRKGDIPRSISDTKFDNMILEEIDPVYYYRATAQYYPHLHQLFISYPKSGSTYNDTQIIYDTSARELISKKSLLGENYSIYGSFEKDLSGLSPDERKAYGFSFVPLIGSKDGYIKEQKIISYQDEVSNYVSKTTHPPTFWKDKVRNKRVLAIDLLIEKYTDEDITFIINLASEANENYQYSYSVTGTGNTGIRRYTIRTDDNGTRIDCRGKEFVPQIEDSNNPYGWELHAMIFRGYYSTDKG